MLLENESVICYMKLVLVDYRKISPAAAEKNADF